MHSSFERCDWTYTLASAPRLALALALNTTVFTVVDAMMFRGIRKSSGTTPEDRWDALTSST